MSFRKLKDIPVTTMVVIVAFVPCVDIDVLFPLLHMASFNTIFKNSKKVALPLLKAGSLVSARYKGVVLGDIQFLHPRFFKNSITVDMSTTAKNVNIKISKGKLHMCGIKNMEMVEEAANLLFQHIRNAERILSLIQDKHLDAALKYVETLDEECILDLDKEVMRKLIYYATKCTKIEQFTDMISCLRKVKDKTGYSEGQIYLLNNKQEKIPQNIFFTDIRRAMANYNFSLGFKVNRGELASRIDGVDGFTARYDNTVNYNVIVQHPHDEIVKKKKDSPHVTFTIYKSGILTISGPHRDVIDPIYEKFMRIIQNIRSDIELGY